MSPTAKSNVVTSLEASIGYVIVLSELIYCSSVLVRLETRLALRVQPAAMVRVLECFVVIVPIVVVDSVEVALLLQAR